MKPIRILIVEDDPAVLTMLEASYRSIFTTQGYHPTIEQTTAVEEARRLAKAASAMPYDFVSLDVNLGDSALTGLDVLATFKRFRSAWMVALLTGVESDATVDRTMGEARGRELRKQLRRDAYASFPAERLLVVEKPSSRIPTKDAQTLLTNRLQQIALVYEEVGRLRYVFRPIEVTSVERISGTKGTKTKRTFIESTARHWQVRFNCGEIRTLPDMAGFRTLHYLLSGGGRPVTPEEALANEPKAEKIASDPSASSPDPFAAYFEAQGIRWRGLAADEQQDLIRAALSLKIKRYVELREFQDDNDISAMEELELESMKKDFGALAEAAEGVYVGLSGECDAGRNDRKATVAEICDAGLHIGDGNYDRMGVDRWGLDSPAAQLFRSRMRRVRDCLRENGFAEFAGHIETFVQSTGAKWSYNPAEGLEWTI